VIKPLVCGIEILQKLYIYAMQLLHQGTLQEHKKKDHLQNYT